MIRAVSRSAVALALGACATAPPADDAPPFVALAPGAAVLVSPSAEVQTHPSVAADGAGWLVAWDEDGRDQRAAARRLDADGVPFGAVLPLARTGGGGFATPDLVVDADGAVVAAVRIADRVELVGVDGDRVSTPVVAGEGGIGFWTAPDLALTADGVVVGWWDGALADAAPATYVAGVWGADGARLDAPAPFAETGAHGSPLALEAHPDGWAAAWSEAGPDGGEIALAVADRAGVLAQARADADDAARVLAPTRPALAVDAQGGVAVGWRVQDEAQQGYGTWLRWFDAALEPLGAPIPLGLAPDRTNRVELDGDGDWVAAVWEEATAEGDVVLQVFDRSTRSAVTGPVRVHEVVAGRQARPAVEVVASGDGARLAVAFEDGAAIRVRTFALSRGAVRDPLADPPAAR